VHSLLYRLPGHAGCVNEVHFHPTEPIIVSAGDDKKMYLGEINP
jgi:Prp8 binding protein